SQAVQHRNRSRVAQRRRPECKDDDDGPLKFKKLTVTQEHADVIKALWPQARILTGAEATKAALKKASAPLFVHLGTHAAFLQDLEHLPLDVDMLEADPVMKASPSFLIWTALNETPLLRSFVALAGANVRQSGEDSGLLTAQEVAGLDLWGTKLVTLAACETGV